MAPTVCLRLKPRVMNIANPNIKATSIVQSHIVNMSDGENGMNLKKTVASKKPVRIKMILKIFLEDITLHST